MVADAEVSQPARPCGLGHVAERVRPVAVGRVVVQRSAQVGERDEVGQAARCGALKLIGALAQFRGDNGEAHALVNRRLGVGLIRLPVRFDERGDVVGATGAHPEFDTEAARLGVMHNESEPVWQRALEKRTVRLRARAPLGVEHRADGVGVARRDEFDLADRL